VPDNKLYVIDLTAEPPKLIDTVTVGRQPSGMSISAKGDLALIANRDGKSVSVVSIQGMTVKTVGEVALEQALRLNGLSIVESHGIYKVIPIADAPRMARINAGNPQHTSNVGYGIDIVPVRYVGAAEMQKLLAPLAPTAEVSPPTDRWKGLADPGSVLAQGLDAIAARDSAFDPKHFLSGARSAYEMIVLAFANGDRRALRDLLSSEVFESFETVIRDREKHEQKTETRFVSIDKAELVGAEMRDRAAQLTVRFVSQMISVTRDKAGTIVDGNPDKVADITDVWTFARDTTSRDPNWKLVGTGSAH